MKEGVQPGLILALDIGTSSLRTALFDRQAQRIVPTTAQCQYSLDYPKDGGAELSPRKLRTAARNCLSQTLGSYRDSASLASQPIIAVGGSCFWHSLMGVDDRRKAVTPIYTWADSRCRDHATRLRGEFDEKNIHRRTGCMLRSSFWPAKLAWLQESRPAEVKRVARWLSPAEWLYLEFLGDSNCSLAMASGTGLFDPTKRRWDSKLLERFSLSADRLGRLSDEPLEGRGRLFPELNGVPWFPALGDGAASNLGSGATRPGLAALNVGTSAALRVMREGDRAVAPFGLFCYRVDHARYLVGGAVSNAGNLRQWCLRELQLPGAEQLERAMSARPEPRHGLTVLPFWTVERAPTWNEETPGVILGLTQNTTALDLLQAAQEATFQRVAMIADRLMEPGEEAPRYLVSGGVQNSESAMRRLADILGESVYANPEKEASLRGAAIFAMEKLGLEIPVFKAVRPLRPVAKRVRLYREQRTAQERLEAALIRSE